MINRLLIITKNSSKINLTTVSINDLNTYLITVRLFAFRKF